MNIDKIINEYIDRERQTIPSPLLKNRIIASLQEGGVASSKITLFQSMVVTASFSLAVVLGLLIGGSYNSTSRNLSNLVVNDSQIENFVILIDNANE